MKGMVSKAFVLTLVLSGVVSASVPVSQEAVSVPVQAAVEAVSAPVAEVVAQVATPSRWERVKDAVSGAASYVADSRAAGYAASLLGYANKAVVAPYNYTVSALANKSGLTNYVSNIGFVKNDRFYNATVGSYVSKVAPYAFAAAVAYAGYRGVKALYNRFASKSTVASTSEIEVIIPTGSVAYDNATTKPVDVKIEVVEQQKKSETPATTPVFNAKAARHTSEAIKGVALSKLSELKEARQLLQTIVDDLSKVKKASGESLLNQAEALLAFHYNAAEKQAAKTGGVQPKVVDAQAKTKKADALVKNMVLAKHLETLRTNSWLNSHKYDNASKGTVVAERKSNETYFFLVRDYLRDAQKEIELTSQNISVIIRLIQKQIDQLEKNEVDVVAPSAK